MDLFTKAAELGIQTEYFDGQGHRHVTDAAALKIIIDAMPVRVPHRFLRSPVVVRLGQKPPIAPYQNRYNAHSHKESLLIRLETDTGLVGWGETPVDWVNKSFSGAPEELLRQHVLGR